MNTETWAMGLFLVIFFILFYFSDYYFIVYYLFIYLLRSLSSGIKKCKGGSDRMLLWLRETLLQALFSRTLSLSLLFAQ
ncbi:uncharacterized protein BDW43DRAFT_293673 [Aspergillus alliaceus]|uniref:uncharacterized protein n=1 Tax=Petromyces alliaceus TaxID=209559 RepID=UPI0012A4B9EA|nr:uncharacterized protein BDW43DRAFT_293673 [Aspergillus alliaceus]KAB8227634.1 hypothetical protein BDW43DRAFT_293673 [Aspergillus alliaceus]